MQAKSILFLNLLLTLALCGSAQDVIYKKNSRISEVLITGRTLNSISYKFVNAVDTSLHMISTAAIDSIVYGNGTREIFPGKDHAGSVTETLQKPKFGRNLMGFDVGAFVFYKTLSLSYEYLMLDNKLGIKAMCGFGFDGIEYYDFDWSTSAQMKGQYGRIGLDYYLFPQGTFRIGTGLHFITSRYKVEGTRYDYSGTYMPYEDEEYRNYNNVALTLFLFYNITRNIAVNAGIDGPLKKPDEPGAVFRAEVLLNF